MRKEVYDKLDESQRLWDFPDVCYARLVSLITNEKEKSYLEGWNQHD